MSNRMFALLLGLATLLGGVTVVLLHILIAIGGQ